jgi:hypothetical protein
MRSSFTTCGFLVWVASWVGCGVDAAAPRPATSVVPAAPSSPGAAPASSVSSAIAPAEAAPSTSVAAAAVPGRPPWVPPADGKRGVTIDFDYDGKEDGDRARAYSGRVFIHRSVFESTGAVPLVVFFHGLNRDLIPHRWMGGGNEGDVREILSDLLDAGALPPVVLAGPGSVQKPAVSFGASFPSFDFDGFVRRTLAVLPPGIPIDRTRVVVLGHSGAGCSARGGIVSALDGEQPVHAIVSIDTCMPGSLAKSLGGAPPETHVVVTWQTASWDREFGHFREVFEAGVAKSPPKPGFLRELDQLPNLPRSHDATVKQTFDKWLPRLLPKAG